MGIVAVIVTRDIAVASPERDLGQNLGTTVLRLVGQILDAKSNVCPNHVQIQSRHCPTTGHVKGLSRQCPNNVGAMSNLCQVEEYFDRVWTEESRDR